MTADNIAVLLNILWTRAEDITCTNEKRVAFHTALLLMGIGGWRPSVVMPLKYSQVEVGVMRDPYNPNQKIVVAHITLYQNKKKANIIYENQMHM